MAEQLLDRAQVGAAVEQVRREAVAQRVRRGLARGAGALRPAPHPAAHVARRQPPAAAAQEQRRARLVPRRRRGPPSRRVRERRPGALEVVAQRGHRGLADGHDARLAALALDPQLLAVVVDVGRARSETSSSARSPEE